MRIISETAEKNEVDGGGEDEMEYAMTESAKNRCRSVIASIQKLPSSSGITASCRRTLLKLASSELSFLSSAPSPPPPLSINIGHLEAVVRILQLPSVTGVSRVCKPLPLPTAGGGGVHVDIVCTLGKSPVWIIVSDRSPRYISWHGGGRHGGKGLRSRVAQVLVAARSTRTLRPCSVILFFANGLPDSVHRKLGDEFGAISFELGTEISVFYFDSDEEIDGGWINVVRTRSYRDAVAVEIKLTDSVSPVGHQPVLIVQPNASEVNRDDSLSCIVARMRLQGDVDGEDRLVNFDTTALVALVSGISNGCAERLLLTPESELKQRFKGNTDFVIAQVRSELEAPMLVEMSDVLSERREIICESVLLEFKELISMCGGPNEKRRADQLLKCLAVVPDTPSERMTALPTTRKLAMKNKVVFGTGDYWRAPTLTANMAFVRAVSQTGMSLATFEHRPRALTGD